jgi:hypothetical protein
LQNSNPQKKPLRPLFISFKHLFEPTSSFQALKTEVEDKARRIKGLEEELAVSLALIFESGSQPVAELESNKQNPPPSLSASL